MALQDIFLPQSGSQETLTPTAQLLEAAKLNDKIITIPKGEELRYSDIHARTVSALLAAQGIQSTRTSDDESYKIQLISGKGRSSVEIFDGIKKLYETNDVLLNRLILYAAHLQDTGQENAVNANEKIRAQPSFELNTESGQITFLTLSLSADNVAIRDSSFSKKTPEEFTTMFDTAVAAEIAKLNPNESLK